MGIGNIACRYDADRFFYELIVLRQRHPLQFSNAGRYVNRNGITAAKRYELC
jgi:hypothetical protein